LFSLGPLPGLSFLGELGQGLGHMQEVLDESLVEVDKSDKQLDFSHTHQGQPVTNASYFDGVHLHPTFREDKTEGLYHGLSKCAFNGFQVEPMSTEDV